MEITSTVFKDMEEIPSIYTCEGPDISPPLHWHGAPENTKSFALIVDDPDAPDPKAPQMTWVHWVVYNIPATHSELLENSVKSNLPDGAVEGTNDWDNVGYGGPCPPIGVHRYFHKIYALDTLLDTAEPLSKQQLLEQIEGHVLATAQVVGTYIKEENR